MTKFSSPFLAKSPLNNGDREIKNDTIYNWNNKQVNKRFSDSIQNRDKLSRKYIDKGLKENNMEMVMHSMLQKPKGTLTKEIDGKTETQKWY